MGITAWNGKTFKINDVINSANEALTLHDWKRMFGGTKRFNSLSYIYPMILATLIILTLKAVNTSDIIKNLL